MSPRMRLEAEVLSNKMDKTAVVIVSRKVAHPRYRKTIVRKRKFYVHADNPVDAGTKVVIEECKPISKTKRWRIVEVLDDKKSK